MKKLIFLILISILLPTVTVFSENCGDTIRLEIEGKIIYKAGNVVKIEISNPANLPIVGQLGELSKKFMTEIFGGKVSGWLSIGEMKVTAISGNIISLNLLKELSVVHENGVKKNHFEIGKEVKFVWKVFHP